jgi:hypothetical protein
MPKCILNLYWSSESGLLKHKSPTSLEHGEKAAIIEADKQLSLCNFFSSFNNCWFFLLCPKTVCRLGSLFEDVDSFLLEIL